MSASVTLPTLRSSSSAAETPADALASPLLRTMMIWTLYAIPIVVAVRPVGTPLLDPDVWWHLRVGQWVAENHALPDHDPFSLTSRPWVAYSFLYELLLYALHSVFGLAGIVVYRAVMALAVVASVHSLVCRLEKRFLVATALTAAAVLALAMLFSERPWLFTILFTTLTLNAVLTLRQPGTPPRWICALPIVYLLWASIHIQFVYGLFLLALACAAPFLDQRLGRPPDETAATPWSRPFLHLVMLSAACLFATFLNPHHVRLYGVVIEYATQPGPFRYINELKALEFRDPCDWVMLGLTGAACWSLGRSSSSHEGRTSAFEVLLLLSAAWFAFRARRDLWFLVLADLAILASADPRLVSEAQRFRLSPSRMLVVGLALAVLAGACAWVHDLSPAGLQRRVAETFPVEAANYVKAHRDCRGPLYNDFNWGGYLIWSLPELPVSIDGRTNLHGDERIERFGRTWAGLPGWENDPDLARAGVVLAPADSALASLLLLDPRFIQVHQDDLARVFVARK